MVHTRKPIRCAVVHTAWNMILEALIQAQRGIATRIHPWKEKIYSTCGTFYGKHLYYTHMDWKKKKETKIEAKRAAFIKRDVLSTTHPDSSVIFIFPYLFPLSKPWLHPSKHGT